MVDNTIVKTGSEETSHHESKVKSDEKPAESGTPQKIEVPSVETKKEDEMKRDNLIEEMKKEEAEKKSKKEEEPTDSVSTLKKEIEVTPSEIKKEGEDKLVTSIANEVNKREKKSKKEKKETSEDEKKITKVHRPKKEKKDILESDTKKSDDPKRKMKGESSGKETSEDEAKRSSDSDRTPTRSRKVEESSSRRSRATSFTSATLRKVLKDMEEDRVSFFVDILLEQYEKEGLLKELIKTMLEEDGPLGSPSSFIKTLGSEEYEKFKAKERLYHIFKENS